MSASRTRAMMAWMSRLARRLAAVEIVVTELFDPPDAHRVSRRTLGIPGCECKAARQHHSHEWQRSHRFLPMTA
jgi:hypothetical protein